MSNTATHSQLLNDVKHSTLYAKSLIIDDKQMQIIIDVYDECRDADKHVSHICFSDCTIADNGLDPLLEYTKTKQIYTITLAETILTDICYDIFLDAIHNNNKINEIVFNNSIYDLDEFARFTDVLDNNSHEICELRIEGDKFTDNHIDLLLQIFPQQISIYVFYTSASADKISELVKTIIESNVYAFKYGGELHEHDLNILIEAVTNPNSEFDTLYLEAKLIRGGGRNVDIQLSITPNYKIEVDKYTLFISADLLSIEQLDLIFKYPNLYCKITLITDYDNLYNINTNKNAIIDLITETTSLNSIHLNCVLDDTELQQIAGALTQNTSIRSFKLPNVNDIDCDIRGFITRISDVYNIKKVQFAPDQPEDVQDAIDAFLAKNNSGSMTKPVSVR